MLWDTIVADISKQPVSVQQISEPHITPVVFPTLLSLHVGFISARPAHMGQKEKTTVYRLPQPPVGRGSAPWGGAVAPLLPAGSFAGHVAYDCISEKSCIKPFVALYSLIDCP